MDLKLALNELAEAVKRMINAGIAEYGVNKRVKPPTNTLEGSELQRTMEVNTIENGIALRIADYWGYIVKGWNRTHKSPERGLYHALVLWAIKKHITLPGKSQSVSAVLVAEEVWRTMIVYERPIPARPFMNYDEEGEKKGEADITKMVIGLDTYIDKWFDDLWEKIMEKTDKYFNG